MTDETKKSDEQLEAEHEAFMEQAMPVVARIGEKLVLAMQDGLLEEFKSNKELQNNPIAPYRLPMMLMAHVSAAFAATYVKGIGSGAKPMPPALAAEIVEGVGTEAVAVFRDMMHAEGRCPDEGSEWVRATKAAGRVSPEDMEKAAEILAEALNHMGVDPSTLDGAKIDVFGLDTNDVAARVARKAGNTH